MRSGPRQRQKGYFLHVTSMSHGEGFLHVFAEMFAQPGLYLMDEPEAALSFSSCLGLVATMHRLGQTGAQVVCATHSPVLAATPGAGIVEIGDHGLRKTTWDDLALVEHWKGYLGDPRRTSGTSPTPDRLNGKVVSAYLP